MTCLNASGMMLPPCFLAHDHQSCSAWVQRHQCFAYAGTLWLLFSQRGRQTTLTLSQTPKRQPLSPKSHRVRNPCCCHLCMHMHQVENSWDSFQLPKACTWVCSAGMCNTNRMQCVMTSSGACSFVHQVSFYFCAAAWLINTLLLHPFLPLLPFFFLLCFLIHL